MAQEFDLFKLNLTSVSISIPISNTSSKNKLNRSLLFFCTSIFIIFVIHPPPSLINMFSINSFSLRYSNKHYFISLIALHKMFYLYKSPHKVHLYNEYFMKTKYNYNFVCTHAKQINSYLVDLMPLDIGYQIYILVVSFFQGLF